MRKSENYENQLRRYHKALWSLLFGSFLLASFESGSIDPWAPAALAQVTDSEQKSERSQSFGRITGLPAFVLRPYYFAATGGRIRLDIRFGLVNDLLQFVKEDANRYHAAYEVSLALFNHENTFTDGRTWKRHLFVTSFGETNDRLHLNQEQATFIAPPGKYELRVEITDLDTRKRLRRNYPIALANIDDQRLQVSALALGHRLQEPDSIAYNFAALLTSQDERQGVYYEVYGLTPVDTLHLSYAIRDWRKIVLETWEHQVTAGAATLRHFEPLGQRVKYQGPQHLTVNVKRGADTASAHVDFRVNLPSFEAEAGDSATIDFRQMPYGVLQYISTNDEFKRIAADASGAERDSLIAAFWRERDPSPGTEKNELREEFYRRVAFAQTRFSVYGADKAGWETDRGRVYIVFGPPHEVHHRLEEEGSSPYEVWLYPHRDRYFIFRDKEGSGDYKLVNR